MADKSTPAAPWPRTPESHPENDLTDDADYTNLRPPEPHDLDELANQPDPLVLADRNRQSTRHALQYLAISLAGTFLFALILGIIFRYTAGVETCQAAGARLLCTPTLQKWWAILVSLPPIGFLAGAMIIMVRQLRGYVRWWPWMGIFWVLLPFTMWVITVTVQVWLADSPAL